MSEPIMYGGNPDYVLGLQKHNGRLARRIKELEDAIRRLPHTISCYSRLRGVVDPHCTCPKALLPEEGGRE